MKKIIYFIVIIFIFISTLFILGCPTDGDGDEDPPEGTAVPTDPGIGSIFGTITDYYTKTLLSGVTIIFGSIETTTDAQGNFTLQLSAFDGDQDITRSFGLYKEGFYFYYIEEIMVNTDGTYEWDFSLSPTDDSSYTLRTISGNVILSDSQELPNFRNINFYIFYQDSFYSTSYQYDGGYSITTPVFGDDCLVLAYANPADGTHDPCVFMETGVDLSADTTPDLTEPAAGNLDTIALSLDQAGNTAKGMYNSPYGYIPVIARYTYNDGFDDYIYAFNTINADNTPESIEIYNPLNWQIIWTQYEEDTGFFVDEKNFFATNTFTTPASAMTLPAIATSFGPTEAADPASLAFSSPVLSQDPVAGAELFVYTFDDDLLDVNTIGMVIAMSDSISLPAWLVTFLNGQNVDIHYSVESYNMTEYSTDFLGSRIAGIMPGTQGGIVTTEGGVSYTRTIQF